MSPALGLFAFAAAAAAVATATASFFFFAADVDPGGLPRFLGGGVGRGGL